MPKFQKYRTEIMGDDFPPITHMVFLEDGEEKDQRFYLTGYVYYSGEKMLMEYNRINDGKEIIDEGTA